MPVHTCSFDALRATVDQLERDGEVLVSVSAANDSTAIILTRPKVERRAGGRETR
jgi:hypothetical protein